MSSSACVLIANRFLPLAHVFLRPTKDMMIGSTPALVTVLTNMAYYGYAPTIEALQLIRSMTVDGLSKFWSNVEPALKEVSGDNRQMADVVVYKNFPAEVLSMTESEYWYNQISIYMGFYEWVDREEEAARPALREKLELKALAPADDATFDRLFSGLVQLKTRWTTPQNEQALIMYRRPATGMLIDVDKFGFKENAIKLIAATWDEDGEIACANATDVLRIAAALSDADISLRSPVKFRNFTKVERRWFLCMLNMTTNLTDDMALRPRMWRTFLTGLHVNDFKFDGVKLAFDQLCKGMLKSVNAQIEEALKARDPKALALVASRPGDFVRRLHVMCTIFGVAAVNAFIPLVPSLETIQLAKLRRYLMMISQRKTLIYPPRGNWSKAQFVPNEKSRLDSTMLGTLITAVTNELTSRAMKLYPDGVQVEDGVRQIKLQTNDQELASYGRGTVFAIPPEAEFIRTASYWKKANGGVIWYDNGWNFFGEDWNYIDTCCWNSPDCDGAAVFSGDPVNIDNLDGRACQMIDIYMSQLLAKGVRYAVWNVLCFSKVPFSGADEVLATLQWGQDPNAGRLYEPARAQMVFPLKGDSLTKYVAYVDVLRRELVYLDANLAGKVSSAESNGLQLAERMPAVIEYLDTLPGVTDLLAGVPTGTHELNVADILNNTAVLP